MGVKGLRKFISCCIRYNHLSEYSNKTMAVDTSIYLYKFKYAGDFLKSFGYQIKKFQKYNITPVYIFDTKPSEFKSETTLKRKEHFKKLNDKLENAFDPEEKSKISRQIIKISPEDITNLKELFTSKNVIFMDSENGCDAEGFCSYLNKNGYVDCVVSEDIDTLAYGGLELVSKLNNKTDEVESILLNDVLDYLDIGFIEFVKLCVISGCDFNNGKKGYGPSKSYKELKSFGDNDQINPETAINYIDIMNIFTKINIPPEKIALLSQKLNKT